MVTVLNLDSITNSINMRITRLQRCIYLNCSGESKIEAAIPGQSVLRGYSDCQDNHIGSEPAA
ncbi:hypothetical protein D3C75_1367890 [compost metagenome]